MAAAVAVSAAKRVKATSVITFVTGNANKLRVRLAGSSLTMGAKGMARAVAGPRPAWWAQPRLSLRAARWCWERGRTRDHPSGCASLLPRRSASTQEVKTILGDGFPFEVTSRGVDLPELQGEPDEVAREKCRLASEEVSRQHQPRPAGPSAPAPASPLGSCAGRRAD